ENTSSEPSYEFWHGTGRRHRDGGLAAPPPRHGLAVLLGRPAAGLSGMQFGRRDDERGREERGELFGRAEHCPQALGVLAEVGGVLVRGRLVVGPPGGAL